MEYNTNFTLEGKGEDLFNGVWESLGIVSTDRPLQGPVTHWTKAF